jgi:hypothetical protein
MLDSADMLKDREEKAALAKVNWYREWFSYQKIIGRTLSMP